MKMNVSIVLCVSPNKDMYLPGLYLLNAGFANESSLCPCARVSWARKRTSTQIARVSGYPSAICPINFRVPEDFMTLTHKSNYRTLWNFQIVHLHFPTLNKYVLTIMGLGGRFRCFPLCKYSTPQRNPFLIRERPYLSKNPLLNLWKNVWRMIVIKIS